MLDEPYKGSLSNDGYWQGIQNYLEAIIEAKLHKKME